MADQRKAGDAGGRHRTGDRRAEDFGSKLREARERKGISLREIANATKISVRALEALERNDISRLPGGIFSRSFVRAYAAEAGLNPDETVDDFVRQFSQDSVIEGHTASSLAADRDAGSDRRRMRLVMWLAAISVAAAALAVHFGIPNRRVTPVEVAVAAPAALERPISGRLAVEVTTARPCHVTIGVDGQPPLDTNLAEREHLSFEAQAELTLTVSDPSAIEILINGVRGRALGAEGVITSVRLTPDNFREFLANP